VQTAHCALYGTSLIWSPIAMTDRPRFFDDLAGVAGGAFSAFAGLRDEAEATIRARIDEAVRKLELVRREDLEAVEQMAANARAGQEAAETRLAALELRLAALESVSVPPSDVERPDPAFPDPQGI
jgi:BMFP domain-containing protein YqiC